LQKRSDGFHDIETVFYPVGLRDVLELVKQEAGSQKTDAEIKNYGLKVEGKASDNLCIKAHQLLKKDFPDLPPVQIHLLKNIPMGAGLGGGSADGACMLQLLSDKFHLNLSTGQLISYALLLGSDCPFFITNQPCHATGRGEIITPINLDLSAYQVVLVFPGIYVNTGWAFSQIQLSKTDITSLKQIVQQPVNNWKQELVNDFETPVFDKYPEIKMIKETLYQQGAVYAAMSGSGSTVFGLFEKENISTLRFPHSYKFVIEDL
jgi:4-diphosphocytidyl-2-C-methyl-D-erythritol kinase